MLRHARMIKLKFLKTNSVGILFLWSYRTKRQNFPFQVYKLLYYAYSYLFAYRAGSRYKPLHDHAMDKNTLHKPLDKNSRFYRSHVGTSLFCKIIY